MAACKEWDLEPDNTIVVLDGGKSESDLTAHLDRLVWWCGNPSLWGEPELKDNNYVTFYEPDLKGEMTGFAIQPGMVPKWILSLPLLFSREGV